MGCNSSQTTPITAAEPEVVLEVVMKQDNNVQKSTFEAFIHQPVENNHHVPYIQIDGNKVWIQVGESDLHAMTDAHYIGEIKLYGCKGKQVVELGSVNLVALLSLPEVTFQVFEIEKYDKVIATSYCSVHGMFWAEKSLK